MRSMCFSLCARSKLAFTRKSLKAYFRIPPTRKCLCLSNRVSRACPSTRSSKCSQWSGRVSKMDISKKKQQLASQSKSTHFWINFNPRSRWMRRWSARHISNSATLSCISRSGSIKPRSWSLTPRHNRILIPPRSSIFFAQVKSTQNAATQISSTPYLWLR